MVDIVLDLMIAQANECEVVADGTMHRAAA